MKKIAKYLLSAGLVVIGYSCHTSKNAILKPDEPIRIMYGTPSVYEKIEMDVPDNNAKYEKQTEQTSLNYSIESNK